MQANSLSHLFVLSAGCRKLFNTLCRGKSSLTTLPQNMIRFHSLATRSYAFQYLSPRCPEGARSVVQGCDSRRPINLLAESDRVIAFPAAEEISVRGCRMRGCALPRCFSDRWKGGGCDRLCDRPCRDAGPETHDRKIRSAGINPDAASIETIV
jgi:hypothetical protein